MSYTFNVTLFRDSLTTPWGFRLEGGKDYQSPLTIQRVFTGSPASGELQRGDIIVGIQNRDATTLFHQEANEIIRNSGGSINLTITRGQAYSGGDQGFQAYRPAFVSQPPVNRSAAPAGGPMTYSNLAHPTFPGHAFNSDDPLSNYIRSRPIEKVKDPKPILSQTGSPIMPGDTPSVNMRPSVKRYRPASTLPILSVGKLPTTNFSGVSNYPVNTNNTPIPFNDKRMASSLQKSLSKVAYAPKPIPPATTAYPGFNHANFVPSQPQAQYSFYDQPGFGNGPAWKESLRKTGIDINDYASTPSSPLLQRQPNKVYSHHEAADLATPKSPQPKVVNLQYNSPIGLYSRENFNEELYKKVGTRPDVKFAPSSEF